MTIDRDAFENNLRREREFMMRLGHAFAEWQSVEQACYLMYARLMKGAPARLTSATFFHIQGFSSKLTLIDRCVFFAITDSALAERWKKLSKRARNLSELRNLLAHSAYIIEGSGNIQTPVLKPSYFDATAIVRKRAMNPEYRIDVDKLFSAKHDFDSLARDLTQFRKDIAAMATKAGEH